MSSLLPAPPHPNPQPGVCFHMYSRQRSDSLADFQLPELRRSPLDEMCLQVGGLLCCNSLRFTSFTGTDDAVVSGCCPLASAACNMARPSPLPTCSRLNSAEVIHR